MIKRFLPVVVAVLFLSACNGGPNNELQAQSEDRNSAKLMDYDENNGFYERNLRDDDKRDYSINTNPNFIDLTEDRPDIGDDQEKIVQVIQRYTEFQPGSVFVNGRDAWVTVHTTEKFSDKEKKVVRKDLHRTLIKAMPRYDIHLKIHDGD